MKETPKKAEMDAMGHMNEGPTPLVESVRKTRKGTSLWERIRMPHPDDVRRRSRPGEVCRDPKKTANVKPSLLGELLKGDRKGGRRRLERVRAEQVVGKEGMAAAWAG